MMRNALVKSVGATKKKVQKVVVYLLTLHVEACHGGTASAGRAAFAFTSGSWFLNQQSASPESHFNSFYPLVFTYDFTNLPVHLSLS